MNHLFRERNFAEVEIDPDDTPLKHDSISLRESRGNWRAGTQRRFITTRRLADWLVSDWHHKRRHMGLPGLDFGPVRCGLTYSLRLGGTWVAADWWLQYFQVDESVKSLRLEHLHMDLNEHLLPLLPPGTAAFEAPPRQNAKPSLQAQEATPFTASDLARIAATNPRWHAWEQQVYGTQG